MLSHDVAAVFSLDLTRLVQQLQAFPDTASLWATAPGVTNAAGTLALHLEGNLREFIGRQLGQVPYTRDRAREFGDRGVEQSELIARIQAIQERVPAVVRGLSDAALEAAYPSELFGRPMSTAQVLIYLTGHFNYHLGQIDYLRRVATGQGSIALARL